MSSNALDALDVARWRRIEAVWDAALELEPRDIAAYLDRACGADQELRREVEALIDADAKAMRFLAVPAAAFVTSLDAAEASSHAPVSRTVSAPEPAAAAPAPDRVGRYRVLGELGRGGMGVVYVGRDDALDREVAIKALPEGLAADPDRLARLLREARLLAMLHHANIAAIHGVEHTAGRRYLILERIAGSTLSERLRAGPLAVREALDLGAQVAEALAAAHALGIVHRDLKPGNIMVTPAGLVKVLDFGLAMHVSDGRRAEAIQRGSNAAGGRAGAHFGTPGYMSPEQILGQPQDARTDLFAFGAVLYQCLTGTRVFAGATPYAVIAATLRATVDTTRLPADTPDEVRELILKALDKDPEHRLADAGEAVAILARRPSPRAARHAPARGRDGVRLPETTTRFVGREREIAACLKLLERTRLVTLTGAGGCGKTRLAIEVARAAHGEAEGPVWFADLATALDAAGVITAVAAALDLRETTESRLVEALARRLGGRPSLLVLDNCDRALAASAAFAARLLAGCPTLRLLATSREWLGVAGEQTLRVPPLSLPDLEGPATRDAIGAAESVRLFTACAEPTGFRLSDATAPLVARVCRALDGVPLAIELTAALLRRQTLEAVAGEVEMLLRRDARADAAPHDTLPAAIQLSYGRLAEEERRCFRALSSFSGGWSLESATAVCRGDGDEFACLDLITRLVDKSLVAIERADRIEPRYRFLEPIRHFAAVRCDTERESEALGERHLDWFLGLAERTAPSLLNGSDQVLSLASLEADHANLLAALERCGSAPDGADKAVRLAGSVWLFWYVRGHFSVGRAALSRALALPGGGTKAPARAQALFAAGGLALFQGDFAEGRRLSGDAHDLYESIGDRLGVARSLVHLALCESGEGRYAEARACYEDAIARFREFGDQRRLSASLNNLGILKRLQGDFAGALADHEEALGLFRRGDDRDGTAVTLVNLGLASARLGRDRDAARHVDEALVHAAELRSKRAGTTSLEVAAELAARRGDPAGAARLIGAARALRATVGLTADEWWRRWTEELADRLRGALGRDLYERLTAEGGELPFDKAIEAARRSVATAEGSTP